MSDLLKTINVNDFIELNKNNKKTTVVDVRTQAEVNNEFFEGCINIPVHEMSAEKLCVYLSECGCADNEDVFLLCGSGQRATKAVEQLGSAISNPLIVIEGGIGAMKQSGIKLTAGAGSTISLERQVRIAAGSLVVLGVILGVFTSSAFYALSAFVGAGLIFAGVTNTCGMAMILARMPWNRVN